MPRGKSNCTKGIDDESQKGTSNRLVSLLNIGRSIIWILQVLDPLNRKKRLWKSFIIEKRCPLLKPK